MQLPDKSPASDKPAVGVEPTTPNYECGALPIEAMPAPKLKTVKDLRLLSPMQSKRQANRPSKNFRIAKDNFWEGLSSRAKCLASKAIQVLSRVFRFLLLPTPSPVFPP